MNTLVINCGSSSVKYALFNANEQVLHKGKRERLSSDEGKSHQDALIDLFTELQSFEIHAIGHRVVHGGDAFRAPTPIDDTVIAAIEQWSPAAPMHNPYALMAIQDAQKRFPSIPNVAVFDTAFHARMPRRASTYAIDHEVATQHNIRRFGFHGISHEYAAGVAADFLKRPLDSLRLVTLHLGNGASACAVEYGRSAETSMGNTPLEGLVMGTRSGDVDAGVLMGLLQSGEYTVDSLNTLLNQNSGLKGLSGLSNDLRDIEQAAADGNDRAQLAINVFAHRARKYVGAYAAAMGGIDAIVFTGGIGENSSSMRERILQRLEFLGVQLDLDRNRGSQIASDEQYAVISEPHSRVDVIVVKTNEERMIARETQRVSAGESTAEAPRIPIAVSARHCHLTKETFEALFGKGAEPTVDKPLVQPGQFACKERVNLIGPRNRIDNVRVLGPLRSVDQVEVARTDEFRLGVDAPVRDSGKVEGSAPITLEGPKGTVKLKEGLICARRHIHMQPEDARQFGVKDKDEVSVSILGGERSLIFGDVLVRVKDSYLLEMHIDTDEANAAELGRGASGGLSVDDIDEDGGVKQMGEAAYTKRDKSA